MQFAVRWRSGAEAALSRVAYVWNCYNTCSKQVGPGADRSPVAHTLSSAFVKITTRYCTGIHINGEYRDHGDDDMVHRNSGQAPLVDRPPAHSLSLFFTRSNGRSTQVVGR